MEENRLYETPESFSLCIWVRERMPDLQEGYLDAMTAEAVRAHLTACYLCNRIWEEMEQTVRLIESLPFVEPVKDFAPAVMAAIRGGPGYSFQDPVVEVETEALERLLSRPRSTTGATERHNHERIRKNGLSPAPERFALRERAAAVFALACALFALLFGPLGSAVTGGLAGGFESLTRLPALGSLAKALGAILSWNAPGIDLISLRPLSGGVAAALLFSLITACAYAAAQRRKERAFAVSLRRSIP